MVDGNGVHPQAQMLLLISEYLIQLANHKSLIPMETIFVNGCQNSRIWMHKSYMNLMQKIYQKISIIRNQLLILKLAEHARSKLSNHIYSLNQGYKFAE
jgi:vesicle coat complex subunit